MGLEAFELVLLRRRADAREYDDAALERIQREHLAYHAALREAGSNALSEIGWHSDPLISTGCDASLGASEAR